MKRNPRKVKWTKAFRKARGKEMVVDSTLQFAARRNVPIRYNRDHISTTLKAMERIREIKLKRERKHYKIRMANNKAIQRELDRKLVEENPHLLPRERASERLAREAEERVKEAEELGVEAMDTTVPIPIKTKQKRKQKLHLDGTIEESMDVD
ncbi:ATPase-activating ribosome biosynthesis protein [Thelotrema lepadinum]|nr:ATPase-activating ribosome biosynthesis protein [Thelotrema lepadinum]